MMGRQEKIYTGFSAILVGTIATNLVAVLFHPVLVRSLGKAAYGRLAVALAVFSILSHLLLLGMRESARKHLTQYSDYIDEISSFAIGTLLLAGLLPVAAAAIIWAAFPRLLADRVLYLVFLTLPALLATNLYKGVRAIFYGLYMERTGELLRTSGQLVFYTGAISFVLLGLGPEGVIFWLTAVPLGFGVMALYLVNSRVDLGVENFLKGRDKLGKELMGFGALTLVSVIFTQLHLQADILFVQFFRGESLTAVYKGAIVAVNFLWMIPVALQKTLLHNYSDMFSNEEMEIGDYTDDILRYTTLLLVLMGTGLFVLAEPFMEIYYGPGFVEGALALKILVSGAVLAGIAKVLAAVLEATGSIRSSVKASVVAALFNLVLNLLLVPVYGINGAAVATGISYGSLLLLYRWFYTRRFSYSPLKKIAAARTLAAAAVTFSVMEAAKTAIVLPLLELAVLPPVGFLVYSILALRLGCVGSDEIEDVLQKSVPRLAESVPMRKVIGLAEKVEGGSRRE